VAAAHDLGVAASHQVVDVPLMSAAVTQHDLHEVACGCGRVHRDRFAEGSALAKDRARLAIGHRPSATTMRPSSPRQLT